VTSITASVLPDVLGPNYIFLSLNPDWRTVEHSHPDHSNAAAFAKIVVDVNKNDIIYDNMDKFINGDLVEKDKRKTAQRFLDAATLDMETLKIRAMVKDSSYFKFIATKADGFIYHMETTTMLGRTPSDCVEYLKNPLNEEILVDLTKKVEKYWNQ
jgi:hypothetical protein